MLSALSSLTKGKSLSSASVAASAVLPVPAAPSRRHAMSGVLSLTRTCSTSALHVVMRCASLGPCGMMPLMRHLSSTSVLAPKAGCTSVSASSKSAMVTFMLSSSSGALMSEMSTCRDSAKDVALFTRPSISAPEKFFVRCASQSRSTSGLRNSFVAILLVWILRICMRPASSGRPTITITSRRPGRSSASSSRSFLLVMAMSSMLFSASTPSIFVSSWFTMLSLTPAPPPLVPRCLQMASISSKMMMWRSLSSPCCAWSASASWNSARMFSSDCPTYLFSSSGPFTTLGSLPLSILPICRAIRVLPVPGGPYSSMPLTCFIPSLATTEGGNTLDAKARRKMSVNCLSSPPIPSVSKFTSLLLNRLGAMLLF
mmetsp:Transcript_5408/g.18801  ORF Transcript_5408/g.18801 Transcript_5408/m.18801 type:complete len:372 (+) Transcript_5408:694-1809(+)